MKSFKRLIMPILLLSMGFSCSSSKKKEESLATEDGKEVSEEKKQEAPKKKPLLMGPQQKPEVPSFKEATEKWGLKGIEATHLYAVDWTNNGVTDLVVLPEYYGPPVFYKWNLKKKKFEKAEKYPFKSTVRASFLSFADFNKDGLLDLIVGTLNQKTELNNYPLRLFLGTKDLIFKEVPGAFPNKKTPTSSISLIDFNMDGWLDVYLGNWFDYSKNKTRAFPDYFYLGLEGGKKWENSTYYLEGEEKYNKDLKIWPEARPTFGTSVCDLDQNGYADILTASSSGYANKVWLNLYDRKNKDRIFKDYALKMKVHADREGSFSPLGGGNSFYMLCQDYNNDGLMDVAAGELFHSYDPESRDRSSILTGSRREFPPLFIRTEYHKDDGSGSWSQGDRRAVWADLNFDSFTDLLVENSGFPPYSRLVLFEQDPQHGFADTARKYGLDIVNPAGIVVADVNDDGRLDILVGQTSLRQAKIKSRLYAFENIFPREGRRVLKVKLKGKEANQWGLGGTVKLHTDQGQYTKVVDYAYGALPSQNQEGLYFGIKKGERPLRLEVRWPLERKNKNGTVYSVRYNYDLKNVSFKTFKTIVVTDKGKITW